jgi:hypothetical protein
MQFTLPGGFFSCSNFCWNRAAAYSSFGRFTKADKSRFCEQKKFAVASGLQQFQSCH